MVRSSADAGPSYQPEQPTNDELKAAFIEGFRSIDAGDTFYAGFQAYLRSKGYSVGVAATCTCSDGGAHGHLPECGWVK